MLNCFQGAFRTAEIRWFRASFAIYLWLALRLIVIAVVGVELSMVYAGS
jgi:hypothetical protein